LRPLRSPRTLWPLWPLRSSLVPLNWFLSDLAGFDRGIDDPLASVRGVVAAVDDAVGVRNGREDDRWRRQANCGDERADRPEIETQNRVFNDHDVSLFALESPPKRAAITITARERLARQLHCHL